MTTAPVLPTAWALLEQAQQTRRPVWVTYHQRRRLICPRALGWKAGRAMILAYQTGGQTSTGNLDSEPTKRWRVLFVDEIDGVATADPTSSRGTADNYNPSHPFPAIDEVFASIDVSPSSTRQ